MIRKLLSTALIIFSCISIQAQNLPYTVTVGGPGVGVPINVINGYPTPYANKDPDYRARYLVRASEFGKAPGLWAIASLGFNVSSAQGAALHNFTIRIQETSDTALSTTPSDDGLVTVYGPVSYADHAGWNTHEFKYPYCWSGTTNLIFDICVQNDSTQKSYNASVNGSNTTFNSSYHDKRADGEGMCDVSGIKAPLTYKVRPTMQFEIYDGSKTELMAVKSTTPGAMVDFASNLKVDFTFKNRSCISLSESNVCYQWNKLAPVCEKWTGDLLSGESITYNFARQLTASPVGFNVLRLWTDAAGDINRRNDTLERLVWVCDSLAPVTYSGKDFWLAFMQNYDNNASTLEQKLFLTSSNKANATISAPLADGGSWSKTVQIPKNTVVVVSVPRNIASTVMATENSEIVSNTGIHIVADKDITVNGLSRMKYSTDGFLAIPTKSIGKEYIATAPMGIYNTGGDVGGLVGKNAPSEFIVVGTEDNTNVTIKCLQNTQLHAANIPWTIRLNAGETYLVKGEITYDRLSNVENGTVDLTGAYVVANRPISLLGGSECAMVPGIMSLDKCAACDHLIEQIMPVTSWGRIFYTTDFEFKPGDDVIRIISYSPGITLITINGNVSLSLSGQGKYIDVKISGGTQIVSDQPIQVVQMCTGGQCAPVSYTDPFMINIVPEEQWGNYYNFITPQSGFSWNYVNIVKKGKITKVGVDGVVVPDNQFVQIGNSIYYACKYPITIGQHMVTGSDILICYVYGFGVDDSYGYPASGAKMAPLVVVPLTLLSFNGVAIDKSIMLKWLTATENNNDFFTIERSADGIDFHVIGTVKSTGSTGTGAKYSFVDQQPKALNYYRLKQTDYNGVATYSGIININLQSKVSDFNVLYVQSSIEDNDLNISLNTESLSDIHVVVYNAKGAVMVAANFNTIHSGNNLLKTNIGNLAAGYYFVEIEQEDNKFVTKIAK